MVCAPPWRTTAAAASPARSRPRTSAGAFEVGALPPRRRTSPVRALDRPFKTKSTCGVPPTTNRTGPRTRPPPSPGAQAAKLGGGWSGMFSSSSNKSSSPSRALSLVVVGDVSSSSPEIRLIVAWGEYPAESQSHFCGHTRSWPVTSWYSILECAEAGLVVRAVKASKSSLNGITTGSPSG